MIGMWHDAISLTMLTLIQPCSVYDKLAKFYQPICVQECPFYHLLVLNFTMIQHRFDAFPFYIPLYRLTSE